MHPLCRPCYLIVAAATIALASAAIATQTLTLKTGDVLRLDPALDRLVPPGAKVEKLAGGLQRAEGPVRIRDGGYLLFSDVIDVADSQSTDQGNVYGGYTNTLNFRRFVKK